MGDQPDKLACEIISSLKYINELLEAKIQKAINICEINSENLVVCEILVELRKHWSQVP